MTLRQSGSGALLSLLAMLRKWPREKALPKMKGGERPFKYRGPGLNFLESIHIERVLCKIARKTLRCVCVLSMISSVDTANSPEAIFSGRLRILFLQLEALANSTAICQSYSICSKLQLNGNIPTMG